MAWSDVGFKGLLCFLIGDRLGYAGERRCRRENVDWNHAGNSGAGVKVCDSGNILKVKPAVPTKMRGA